MISKVVALHVANTYIIAKYIVRFIARPTILTNSFLPMRVLSALSCFIFSSTSKQLRCYLSISINKFCNFYDGIIYCLL